MSTTPTSSPVPLNAVLLNEDDLKQPGLTLLNDYLTNITKAVNYLFGYGPKSATSPASSSPAASSSSSSSSQPSTAVLASTIASPVYRASALGLTGLVGKPTDQLKQSASIASTRLCTAASNAAGVYQISAYLLTSTVGSAGTCTLTVAWNDGSASQSTTLTLTLSGTSSKFVIVPVYLPAGQSISYSTVVSGASGSPTYDLHLRVEYLG